MPVIAEPPAPETVKDIRVQIGKEWHAVSFGGPVDRAYAIQRAQEILRAMAGETNNG